jgi:ankyrin repeat protein
MEILLKRKEANPNLITDHEMIELLLNNGADANAAYNWLSSPLMSAVYGMDSDVVEILLSHGADPNLSNSFGTTALHHAVTLRGTEILEMLLNHGAKIDATNDKLETPLMYALFNTDAAKILLSHQANPNLRNIFGESALHKAVSVKRTLDWRKYDVAKILLRNKANPNLRNNYGETALDVAVNSCACSTCGGTDLVILLLKHRAKGNVVSANKLKTQIKLALFYSHWIFAHQMYQFVKMLLKAKRYQILIVSAFLVLFFSYFLQFLY